MAIDKVTSKEIEPEGLNQEADTGELNEEELDAVSGGSRKNLVPRNEINFGDIKGESTEKDHKDW